MVHGCGEKAELCDCASVKGCMVIKPAGYAIWENIQNEPDRRFRPRAFRTCMPLFIPESLLQKEKDHVRDSPRGLVTHGVLSPAGAQHVRAPHPRDPVL